MPTLKYWDVGLGAYQLLTGPMGPQGPQGPTGPQGPVGVSATDSIQNNLQSVSVGTMPPAGTRILLYVIATTPTTNASGLATISLTAAGFQYGYLPMAMVGDATPSNNLGCTVRLASCTLTSLALQVWNNNNAGINSTTVRLNIWCMGA